MIQISHAVSENRNTLTLRADKAALQELRELRDESPDWGRCAMEAEVCEYLVANSELDWLSAADTADLTDAPILGITASEEEKSRKQTGHYGSILVGGDSDGNWYLPISERWGYEPYQIRSFLDDLLEKGEAVFINAW